MSLGQSLNYAGRLCLAAWVLSFAACTAATFLAPAPDRSRFFVLSPAAEVPSHAPTGATTPRIAALTSAPTRPPCHTGRPTAVTRVPSYRREHSEPARPTDPRKPTSTPAHAHCPSSATAASL